MYKVFFSVLSLYLLLHSSHSLSQTQFEWNQLYVIQVDTSQVQDMMYYLINITVKDKITQKTVAVFQEEGIPLEFKVKKIGKQELFFYSVHSGGESGGITTLKYVILKEGRIENHVASDSPASFKFLDVDHDGIEEIVTHHLRFEWFEVEENCSIMSFYPEYFETLEYFIPKILTFKNDRFVDNTFEFKEYLQKHYLALLEKRLRIDEYEKNYIAGFIQYFFISAQLKQRKAALTFIKKNNKAFQYYHCQDDIRIQTTVFDFIKKHQQDIIKWWAR